MSDRLELRDPARPQNPNDIGFALYNGDSLEEFLVVSRKDPKGAAIFLALSVGVTPQEYAEAFWPPNECAVCGDGLADGPKVEVVEPEPRFCSADCEEAWR